MEKAIGRRRSDQSGFTFSEVLVVVMIVAVAAAIMLPDTRGSLAAVRLDSTTKEIAFSLDLARMKAVALNTPSRVTFDPDQDSFKLELKAGTNWVSIASKSLPESIDLLAGGSVTFSTSGMANSTSLVALGNERNEIRVITMSRAGGVLIKDFEYEQLQSLLNPGTAQ